MPSSGEHTTCSQIPFRHPLEIHQCPEEDPVGVVVFAINGTYTFFVTMVPSRLISSSYRTDNAAAFLFGFELKEVTESRSPSLPQSSIDEDALKISEEERAQMNPFRARYENEYERPLHISMLKNEICQAVFDYWEASGLGPTTTHIFDEKVKRLMAFVRNNWRRPHPIRLNVQGKVNIRIHDLVWELMRDKVNARIREILNSPTDVSCQDANFFKTLNTAISDVRHKLSIPELTKLEKIKKERSTAGHPPEKQKKLYEKEGDVRCKRSMSALWLELGMVQLTFAAARNQKGQWVVEVYDQAAKLMGVTSSSFRQHWPQEVEDLESKYLQYVESLADLTNPTGTPTQTGIIDRSDLQVRIDDNGYPIMPAPPKQGVYQEAREVQKLFRTYLNKHYELASGFQYSSAPHALFDTERSVFIDEEYIPNTLVLKDVARMTRDEVLLVIDHIRGRQAVEVSTAFRFNVFKDRAGTMHPARYDRSHKVSKAAAVAAKQKTRRKKQKTGKGKGKKKALPVVAEADDDDEQSWNMNVVDNIELNPGTGASIDGTMMASGSGIVPIDHQANSSRPKPRPRGIASTRETSSEENVIEGVLEIDEATYQNLRSVVGCPVLSPINGPNEGPPRYVVASAMWANYRLAQHSTFTVADAGHIEEPNKATAPYTSEGGSTHIPGKLNKTYLNTAPYILQAGAAPLESTAINGPDGPAAICDSAAPNSQIEGAMAAPLESNGTSAPFQSAVTNMSTAPIGTERIIDAAAYGQTTTEPQGQVCDLVLQPHLINVNTTPLANHRNHTIDPNSRQGGPAIASTPNKRAEKRGAENDGTVEETSKKSRKKDADQLAADEAEKLRPAAGGRRRTQNRSRRYP
ncbi:hypothetical protein BDN70DRAFT_901606 [Pholiota conissans]|uniref:Uncharacterized protein n=1 Tax=Pholiota conissans TaxID=109636 RepID=A0A9P5YJS9_9AGAR|nr:hypothetical protein BDN70DRAFT_901606 [Pholiota conissans]